MIQISVFPKLLLGTFISPIKLWQKEMQDIEISTIEDFILNKVLSFYVVEFFLYAMTKSIFSNSMYFQINTFLAVITIFILTLVIQLFVSGILLYLLIKILKKDIKFINVLYIQFYTSIPLYLGIIFKNIPIFGNYFLALFVLYSLYLLWLSLNRIIEIKSLQKSLFVMIVYAMIINSMYFQLVTK